MSRFTYENTDKNYQYKRKYLFFSFILVKIANLNESSNYDRPLIPVC